MATFTHITILFGSAYVLMAIVIVWVAQATAVQRECVRPGRGDRDRTSTPRGPGRLDSRRVHVMSIDRDARGRQAREDVE